MKTAPSTLWLLPLAVGLAAGWKIKSHRAQGSPERTPPPAQSPRKLPSHAPEDGKEIHSTSPSSDTAADLHALSTADLYDRLALFLLTAKPGDFPIFYEEFKTRPNRSDDLNGLLFINWTRLDPEAAIAATRGTDDFRYTYWAWACHDPGKALATAIERNEGIENAASGIGEFHPAWLKKNWNLIPKNQRINALQGLTKWPDTQNPEDTLRTFMAMGSYSLLTDEKTLLALARQDPVKAYQFFQETSANLGSDFTEKILDSLLNTLSLHEPSLLGEIAAASKSPVDKNKIQLAQFESLLRQTPESAKAMIESTPKSILKEDLSISYANHLLSTDPEKGFEYGVDFLKNDHDSSGRVSMIRHENGQSFRGHSYEAPAELISNLIRQNPSALLNEFIPDPNSKGGYNTFRNASSRWAHHDLDAYAEWVQGHQDNPVAYQNGVTDIVSNLKDRGEFEAGMEWAQSVPTKERGSDYQIKSLFKSWSRRHPEAATAWRLSDKFTGNPADYPIPKTTDQE